MLTQAFADSFRQVQTGLGQQFSNINRQITNRHDIDMTKQTASHLPLGGRWHKDKSASDMNGYGRSLDLMGIHGEDRLEIHAATAACLAAFVLPAMSLNVMSSPKLQV